MLRYARVDERKPERIERQITGRQENTIYTQEISKAPEPVHKSNCSLLFSTISRLKGDKCRVWPTFPVIYFSSMGYGVSVTNTQVCH